MRGRHARLMTLLVKRTESTRASPSISHSTLNARRSCSARRLQMSSVSGLGSMSMRRCTRYVVVALNRQQDCVCGAAVGMRLLL